MSFLNNFIQVSPLFLISFFAFVIIAIAIDIIVLNKQGQHKVSIKEALTWSGIWIGIALLFNIGIWLWFNSHGGLALANLKASEFFVAYLVEKSLSIDNLFVFLTVFSLLRLQEELQKKVILIGIAGAIILRTIMIFLGIWLINEFSWVLYVFGAFLILTGIKMLWAEMKEEENTTEEMPKVMTWLMKLFPISTQVTEKFFVKENGKLLFTTVFIAVITISIVDIIFAVDSIPAVIAITSDPYIVLSSNILALLGLRALYFVLAVLKEKFWALGIGLGIVLGFIGLKMMFASMIHLNPFVSLVIIVSIMTVSIIYSMKYPKVATQHTITH